MLAAILTISGTMTMLTSCIEFDNPVNSPNPEDIVGWWYTEYNKQGTFSINDENVNYCKVVQAACFNEDGTGLWTKFFIDDTENLIIAVGGELTYFKGEFLYNVGQNGNVDISVTFMDPFDNVNENIAQWSVEFTGSQIYGKDGDEDYNLTPITEDQHQKLNKWLDLIIGGLSVDKYEANIDFNTSGQWRNEEYIYIYSGKGTDTDDRGKAGYEIIPLPWNSEASEWNGPQNFFEDVTPENGWELALDLCGRPNFKNYNYFALYNKYTGTLRIFTYIDNNLNVSDGNDVLFELTMGEQTSHLMSMKYGLPTSTANWKDKTKLGQPANGGHIFATPWVANRSTDGLVTPAPGWWAYDVDLSQYRPEVVDKFKDEKMSLNMRVWHKDHVSLMGSINANIDGNIKAEIKQEKITTAGNDVAGFFAKLDELTEGEGLFSKFKSYFDALKKGDPMGSFKAGVDVLKYACKLSGSLQEGTIETFDKMTGQLNFSLNGTINTSGYIQGSRAVIGMVNPTVSNNLFFSNSTVGQGVWNLKNNPEIVRTNYGFDLNHYTDKDGINPFYVLDEYNNLLNADYAPRFGWITYFDPTSIEVELNPNVFPEEDIEWMQVDAIPMVRASNAMRGTDLYREQLGLNSRYVPTLNANRQKTTKDRKANGYTFHFFDEVQGQIGFTKYQNMPKPTLDTSDTETWGLLNWPSEWKGNDRVADNRMGCVGDINSDRTVAIDPQTVGLTYNEPGYDAGERYWGNAELAAYEIMVTVTVKLKDRQNPIVLSRMYLPNFKTVDISITEKVADEWTRMVEKVNADDMKYFNKQAGHMNVLKHELKRIYHILYDIDSNAMKNFDLDWLENEL